MQTYKASNRHQTRSRRWRQCGANFGKIRPLAYTVASRFDDRDNGTILDVCERLRTSKSPGIVLASKKAMIRKMMASLVSTKISRI